MVDSLLIDNEEWNYWCDFSDDKPQISKETCHDQQDNVDLDNNEEREREREQIAQVVESVVCTTL